MFEPAAGGLEQRGREFVFAVVGEAFYRLRELLFRDTQVVDQKFRAVGAGEMLARNLVVYGLGGLAAPFVGIKAIDLVLTALHIGS